MIKAHSSGKIVSSGISDVAIASVNSEKTCLKKLMVMMKMMIIILQVTEKPFTSKYKKEMQGWLNASLKSTKTRDELDELQLPAILCQDACQRLMLHPYITDSRTIINIVLSYVEFRHWTLRPVASLVKGGLLGIICHLLSIHQV